MNQLTEKMTEKPKQELVSKQKKLTKKIVDKIQQKAIQTQKPLESEINVEDLYLALQNDNKNATKNIQNEVYNTSGEDSEYYKVNDFLQSLDYNKNKLKTLATFKLKEKTNSCSIIIKNIKALKNIKKVKKKRRKKKQAYSLLMNFFLREDGSINSRKDTEVKISEQIFASKLIRKFRCLASLKSSKMVKNWQGEPNV